MIGPTDRVDISVQQSLSSKIFWPKPSNYWLVVVFFFFFGSQTIENVPQNTRRVDTKSTNRFPELIVRYEKNDNGKSRNGGENEFARHYPAAERDSDTVIVVVRPRPIPSMYISPLPVCCRAQITTVSE